MSLMFVALSFFQSVGSALIRALEKHLGGKFTTKAKEAWTAVYKIMAEAMKEGAKKAQWRMMFHISIELVSKPLVYQWSVLFFHGNNLIVLLGIDVTTISRPCKWWIVVSCDIYRPSVVWVWVQTLINIKTTGYCKGNMMFFPCFVFGTPSHVLYFYMLLEGNFIESVFLFSSKCSFEASWIKHHQVFSYVFLMLYRVMPRHVSHVDMSYHVTLCHGMSYQFSSRHELIWHDMT